MNKKVIEWYSDQIAYSVGLIISMPLFIILIKKLVKSQIHSLTLKITIYCIFISGIISFIDGVLIIIALPIFSSLSPSTDQSSICNILYIFAIPCFALFYMLTIIYMIERLYISFKNSLFALSKSVHIAFKAITLMIWFIVIIASFLVIDSSPYNIYTKSIDLNGNGITCSASIKQQNYGLIIVSGIAILTMVISNIIIWILFINKFYKLLKSMSNDQTSDFIIIMKQQTMLIGIMVFSTIFLWIIQIAQIFGNLPGVIDNIITMIVIFVSFKFNTYYFNLLRCNKATNCCCKSFEQCMIRQLQNDNEIQMAQIITTLTTEKSTNSIKSLTTDSPHSSDQDVTSMQTTKGCDFIEDAINTVVPQSLSSITSLSTNSGNKPYVVNKEISHSHNENEQIP